MYAFRSAEGPATPREYLNHVAKSIAFLVSNRTDSYGPDACQQSSTQVSDRATLQARCLPFYSVHPPFGLSSKRVSVESFPPSLPTTEGSGCPILRRSGRKIGGPEGFASKPNSGILDHMGVQMCELRASPFQELPSGVPHCLSLTSLRLRVRPRSCEHVGMEKDALLEDFTMMFKATIRAWILHAHTSVSRSIPTIHSARGHDSYLPISLCISPKAAIFRGGPT